MNLEEQRKDYERLLTWENRGIVLERTAISVIGIFCHNEPWEYCTLSISCYIPRILRNKCEDPSHYSIIDNGRNKIIISTPEIPVLHTLTVDGDAIWTGRLHLRAFVTKDEAESWCRFMSCLSRRTLKPEQEFAQTHLIYPWLY